VLKGDVKLQLTNFWCQRSRRNANGVNTTGAQNRRAVGKIGDLYKYDKYPNDNGLKSVTDT